MLLHGRRRARVLLDISRHRDGLDVFQALKGGALTPLQELAIAWWYAIRVFLLRIGTVKNSKNRLVASGPTSATSAGTWNDSALATVKAASDIGARAYRNVILTVNCHFSLIDICHLCRSAGR